MRVKQPRMLATAKATVIACESASELGCLRKRAGRHWLADSQRTQQPTARASGRRPLSRWVSGRRPLSRRVRRPEAAVAKGRRLEAAVAKDPARAAARGCCRQGHKRCAVVHGLVHHLGAATLVFKRHVWADCFLLLALLLTPQRQRACAEWNHEKTSEHSGPWPCDNGSNWRRLKKKGSYWGLNRHHCPQRACANH